MRLLAILAAFALPILAQTNSLQKQRPESVRTASDSDDLPQIAQELVGKATFLRCVCEDSKLSYDATGALTSPILKTTDWTLAAINIEKAERKDLSHIELTGTRAALRYNEYSKVFDRRPLKLATVHIEVVANDAAQLREALDKIFSIGIDYRLQQSTSPLWKRYFNPALPWADDEMKGRPVFVARANDSTFVPAKATKKVDVKFTIEAIQNRVSGSILLKALIDTDGTPHRIAIDRPLGYGLDEKAAEALRQWHFLPATKDGQPVVAPATIEMRILAPPPPKPVM